MANLKELRDERLRKLNELRQLGIDPYPPNATRTNYNAEVQSNFDELEGSTISVVGRIKSIRKFGKIAFIVIKDDSGELQLFLKNDKNIIDVTSTPDSVLVESVLYQAFK